jgi:hypothetical protein
MTVKITCPHCGFTRDIPSELVPKKEVQVTCPKCKQRFPLSTGRQSDDEITMLRQIMPDPVPEAVVPLQPPPKSTNASTETPDSQLATEPFQKPSIAEKSLHQGGVSSRTVLLIFVLIIAILVGIRLWADGKKRSVPFPNFIATSVQGVAVSWGQDIYFLDHAGKVVRKQSLPQDVILTQIKFVGDELWIANYAKKNIQRLRNNNLETVVNGAGRFRGAFKFVVDIPAGRIFVTDASNHKVHVFSTDGRLLDSFGNEGKGPAELMFPNTIAFDSDGNLLIVNTNTHRIDVFARDGKFIKSFAKVEEIAYYRFPTLLAQVGDKVAFLLTVDLREAKVIMYGSDGRYLGELVPPKHIHESGDVAAWEGNVLVSDNKERKVYRFSADSLAYMGPFSTELDALGAEASRLESRYTAIAKGALIALLVSFIPVLFIYLRIRRRELKKIETTDFSRLVSPEGLWTVDLNRKKMAFAMVMLVIALLFMFGGITNLRGQPVLTLALYTSALISIVAAIHLITVSGYANPARKETLERLVKFFYKKAEGILCPGECLEGCTAVRLRGLNNHIVLLLLTNRRLLICDISDMRSGIRQLGYGDIAATALKPVKPSSKLLPGLLKDRNFSLSLRLKDGVGETVLQFSGSDRLLIDRIRLYLEDKRIKGESLGCSMLCDTCFRPVGADGCIFCAQSKKNDWKPLVLSLIYPGLGQFYNRELVRGTVNSALFTAGILILTMPVTKMMDRSAEFTSQDVNFVAQYVAALLFLYVVSFLDADQVGRKGRKLFSAATGSALGNWLRNRVAVMEPFRRKLFVELVPGVAHAMAGKYRRVFLFFIPFSYLFWTVGWSLMLIVSGHSGSIDYPIFEFGSALASVLCIVMTIDGTRMLNQERLPIRITIGCCLTLLSLPLITLATGFLAQLLQEKIVEVNPILREAIHLSFLPGTFLGWGSAIMAMFGAISLQGKESKPAIVRASIVGFLGGIACWTICKTALDGVTGSLLLLPVLFGSVVGLFTFIYFRKTGASPLLVPAIMSGAVVGSLCSIFSSPLLFNLRPLLGSGATRIFMVAFPAYFMHLAYLLMSKAMPVAHGYTSKSDG